MPGVELRPPRLIPPLAALIACLALAACGDESTTTDSAGATTTSDSVPPTTDSSTSTTDTSVATEPVDDEAQIADVTTAVLGDPDSRAVCTGSVTEAFIAASYGSRGACKSGRPPDSLADRTKVREIEVSGDGATAVAGVKGGQYDGVTIDVTLVRLGDDWLVDELSADIPVGP